MHYSSIKNIRKNTRKTVGAIAAMFIFSMTLFSTSVFSQVILDSVAELSAIDIVENLGGQIPLDLKFQNQNGQEVILADYFNQDKPVLLVLAYYECPMLCNLVLNGLGEGINDLGWVPGEKFDIVTVSIDPEETPELALAKRQNYLNWIHRPELKDGWDFLVGEQSQSEALADALGFKYFYDEERDEYAHAACLYLLTPDGEISRYLYGIEFKSKNLKLGLTEASQGKIGNTIDRIILYCFQYDPDANGYVLMASKVMKLGGVVTLILLVGFIAVLRVRDKRRMKMLGSNQAMNELATKE